MIGKIGNYYNFNSYEGSANGKKYGLVYDRDTGKWVRYDDLTSSDYADALKKSRENYKYFGRLGSRKIEKTKGGYKKRARERIQSRRKR